MTQNMTFPNDYYDDDDDDNSAYYVVTSSQLPQSPTGFVNSNESMSMDIRKLPLHSNECKR